MPDRLILAMLITAGTGVSDQADGLEAERATTCRVHGPSRLASAGDSGTSDYVPYYTGECRDGVAHGQGKLEWRMRWTPGRNRAVWDGRFVDGVFVGTQAVDHVRPLPGDRYLILLASDGQRRIWLVARSGQFDPVSVCDIDRVVLDADPDATTSLVAGDDAQVRALIQAAADAVRARCPSTEDIMVEVYEHVFRLGPNDNWPTDAFASARVSGLASGDSTIAGYSNSVSRRAQQAARADERAARLRSQRAQVEAFAAAHSVATWLTCEDIDRNPYAWQGRRIGMLLRLERMIDAHTALATQATDARMQFIVVTGVTPTTFSGPASAVVTEVTPERIAIAGFAQPLAQVRLIAGEACDDATCSAWLGGIAWVKSATLP